MTKLEDDEIKTPDPRLKDILSNIISAWNAGNISFNEVSTVPTDTPADVQLRAFHSGGTYRIYMFFPSTNDWHYVDLT